MHIRMQSFLYIYVHICTYSAYKAASAMCRVAQSSWPHTMRAGLLSYFYPRCLTLGTLIGSLKKANILLLTLSCAFILGHYSNILCDHA